MVEAGPHHWCSNCLFSFKVAGCLKVIFTLINYMMVFIVVVGESLILLLIYKVVSLYFLEGEEKYFERQGFKTGYQISD